MFVGFALLSFSLFAPTILLPVIREHCELLAEEARLQRLRGELKEEMARRSALLEAFARDVTINERLAVLDLHYARPDEEVLPVLPQSYTVPETRSVATADPPGPLLIPADWPALARRLERWAGERGIIGVFLDRSLRPAILFMAGGLLVAAFVLFAPRAAPVRPPAESAAGPLGVNTPRTTHPAT